MITQEQLKAVLDYDSVIGWFINRYTRGPAAKGKRAGSPTGHGYRKVTIDHARFYEHHLAWFYVYGEWPEEIDHEDRNRSNNAIYNLRLATRTQNCFNAKRETGASGLRGAYLDRRTMQWYSHIQVGGQVEHLGLFDSAAEAHKAFMAAVERRHGEFAFRTPDIDL